MTALEPRAAAAVEQVSQSKLGVWLRCQAQFAFRYFDGMKKPPSAGMALGRAFDDATNGTYAAHIATGDLPPQKDAEDRFASAWDRERKEVEEWHENEDAGDLLDSGARTTGEWRARIAPAVQPEAVQVAVTFHVEDHDEADRVRNAALGIADGYEVHGIADLIAKVEGTRVVVDHKLKVKSMRDDEAAKSMQPAIYCGGTGTQELQLHVGVRTKQPKVQVVRVAVSEDDIDHIRRVSSRVRRAIAVAARTGDVIPNRQHMLCSRRWCGYWRECQQAYGGTVAE